MAQKFAIRKNDLVMVIAGRERGKTGKVLRVLPETGKAVVERLNVVKRHSKPRGATSPGGIVEKESAIHISNRMFFCERCNAPTRLGVRTAADKSKARVCRNCHESLGSD